MSELMFKVEAFAGSNISDVCVELIELAKKLNVTVMSDFNGVQLMACPGDDAEGLEEAWRRELAQDRNFQSIARDIYYRNPEFPGGKPARTGKQ